MRLLAIDPGKEGLAFALFVDRLFAEGSVHRLAGALGVQCSTAARLAAPYVVGECVVEEMVYYPQRGSAQASAKIREILRLQAIGTAAAYSSGTRYVHYVPARDWKGQVPKKVMQGRIERVLTPVELERAHACAAKYGERGHNLWDALGIGLDYLGRL